MEAIDSYHIIFNSIRYQCLTAKQIRFENDSKEREIFNIHNFSSSTRKKNLIDLNFLKRQRGSRGGGGWMINSTF